MQTCAKLPNLVSIEELTKEEILLLLAETKAIKQAPPSKPLAGKILGCCFFEPSTRTRLSFETAMLRLGGSTIGFSEPSLTSSKKGESLSDTIRMMELYADALVLRHPMEGAARLAAEISSKPVINAGDGSNQHPTQTLLDLFTIQECQGKLDELHITLAGDLKFGRTIHSLAVALTHFNPRLYFVSPPDLEMPQEVCTLLRQRGVKYSYHTSLDEVIQKSDILYMTRVQQERMASARLKAPLTLTVKQLAKAKDNLKVLHPLPRVGEIDPLIDATPYAHYFQQAENGIYTRQALLLNLLQTEDPSQ